MGKFFVKLFKYFLTTFLICLTIITVSKLKSYTKNKIFIDNDELTIGQMIHNSMADVDNYLFNRYGFYMNYSCITTHNYGLLSCENVNQSTLKNYYNNLYDLRFDLNSDNIINDNDNLGQNGGICQPTAVTIGLRYLTERNTISYFPRLSNDNTNIYDVFYEVVDNYIAMGWAGSGATSSLCRQALNSFFINNNLPYQACYTTNNYLEILTNCFNNRLPAIGHISGDNGAHAVTICGYYGKHITYIDDTQPLEEYELEEYDFYEYYAGINTGWVDTVDEWALNPDPVPQSLYDDNYSFVNLNDFYGVTYICEIEQ